MKWKEPAGDEFDTDEELPDDNWADKVIAAVDNIPIVTRLMKGMGGGKYITTLVPNQLIQMAEYIKDKSPVSRKIFSTTTEVHRAAEYIGIRILYKLAKANFSKNHPAHSIDKTFQVTEEGYENFVALSALTDSLKKLYKSRQCGIVSPKNYERNIQDIVNCAPELVRSLLIENRKKIEAGEKVIDLYDAETKTWGGARQGAGRKSKSRNQDTS